MTCRFIDLLLASLAQVGELSFQAIDDQISESFSLETNVIEVKVNLPLVLNLDRNTVAQHLLCLRDLSLDLEEFVVGKGSKIDALQFQELLGHFGSFCSSVGTHKKQNINSYKRGYTAEKMGPDVDGLVVPHEDGAPDASPGIEVASVPCSQGVVVPQSLRVLLVCAYEPL